MGKVIILKCFNLVQPIKFKLREKKIDRLNVVWRKAEGMIKDALTESI